jgi:hypothetical protein
MLPQNVRALFAEVVTNHRREHQTGRDKAIKDFTLKMNGQGISQSSASNDGKVKIYCEAFEKYAAGVWDYMQKVLEGGFEVYPGCEDDLINFLKESLAVVCDADTKSLFAIKNETHTPTARHLARCKPRFEFPCQAVTEKLTTEIKIFVNQLRAINEKEAALPPNASPKVEAAKSAPDYFTSIEAAAAYAGKTKRTIFNWKKRKWLKVEQAGRKIRIDKTELDKCTSKQ